MKITCRVCHRETDAFLCSNPCAADLERAFGDLPGLLGDVVDSLARQTRVYRSAARPGTPDEDWRGGDEALEGHPLPVDFDAGVLLARVGNTLSTWARHLAEARGLHFAPIPEGPTCERCSHRSCTVIGNAGKLVGDIDTPHRAAALVRWFLINRNAIRYDEAAAGMHADILRLRDDLRRFVDRSPSPFFAGPCHARITDEHGGREKCQRDLYAWINPFRIDPGGKDRPTVTCNGYRSSEPGDEGCGEVHTLADRREWLLASVEDALLTIPEMCAVMPSLLSGYPQPPKSVMQAWVRQGRLVAKSITSEAEERYRGGDMIELIMAYRPHAYSPRASRSA